MSYSRIVLLLLAVVAMPANTLAQEPRGWFLRGQGGAAPAYNVAIDTVQMHSGRAGAYIESSAAQDDFGTLMQAFAPEQYRGRRVRLSAFLRTQDVTGAAGLWMRVEARGDITLGFDNMMDRPIRGTTGWSQHQVVLDIPAEAQTIAMGVLLVGNGRVWADDFELMPVDSSTAATNRVQPGEPGSSGRPQSPPAAGPLNLDFEN
jgi:hypothetical protein